MTVEFLHPFLDLGAVDRRDGGQIRPLGGHNRVYNMSVICKNMQISVSIK
jgi:hypothetical protein